MNSCKNYIAKVHRIIAHFVTLAFNLNDIFLRGVTFSVRRITSSVSSLRNYQMIPLG